MQIRTVLNRVVKYKGFVFEKDEWGEDKKTIEVFVRPRRRSRGCCSRCGRPAVGYDHLEERRFSFLPLWLFTVVLVYTMRRVQCPTHGVVVETVPWANGKSCLTMIFSLFLARWAKRLSWRETAEIFEVNWVQVHAAVKYVVDYGMKRRDLSGVTAIGVDEVQYGQGHQYLTLVYDIGSSLRRLLYVGKERKTKSLLCFFESQGRDWCHRIQFVCSDMWKPYLRAISTALSKATHILDRFHIVQKLNKALDLIRAEEARDLRHQGKGELLTHTKYCFLKNPENLTPNQKLRLKDVLCYKLKSVRAYLLKESFQAFWSYSSPHWAQWYLGKWCARAMRSRLTPIKKFVGMIRRHEPLILNWFKAKKQFSSGVIEGLNRKVNLITRRAYGFRTFDVLQVVLMHNLGELPEPELTHRFC
jgi:transposase